MSIGARPRFGCRCVGSGVTTASFLPVRLERAGLGVTGLATAEVLVTAVFAPAFDARFCEGSPLVSVTLEV
jgi:hypothetical protein